MTKIFPFPAQRMDLGLNQDSIRNLEPGQISAGSSVRYERGSAIYTGPGFRTACDLATTDATYGLREALVFPALWSKSGTKIFYSTDGVTSYDTGVTATAAETTDWFQEQGNGDILHMNQTDTNIRFAVAKNTVIVNAADTTVTVGAAYITKFAASGSVIINGVSYSYSGVNATQMTGFSAFAAGFAVGTLIVQSTNPTTWVEEKGTFSFELETSMYIGGVLGYENILYCSAPDTTGTTPQYFYDFDANGKTSGPLPGKLTGGIKGINRAYIFTNNQCFQHNGRDPTTGNFLITPLSEQYGAYNPHCIVDMEGTIAFFGGKRLIPIIIGLGPPGVLPAPSLGINFDQRIRTWLSSLDDASAQAQAKLHYDKDTKILKIQGVRNGALETYFYDRANDSFGPSEVRSASSYSMFLGRSYFGHSSNGVVYLDDEGRTNDGLAIAHSWSTGELEFDKGRRYLQAHTLAFDGYMTTATEFTVNVYKDHASTADYTGTFDDTLITSTVGVPLGSRGVGISTIGGSDDTIKAYPYRCEILLIGLSGEDFRVEWLCSTEGGFLQVNSYLLTTIVPRGNLRTRS